MKNVCILIAVCICGMSGLDIYAALNCPPGEVACFELEAVDADNTARTASSGGTLSMVGGTSRTAIIKAIPNDDEQIFGQGEPTWVGPTDGGDGSVSVSYTSSSLIDKTITATAAGGNKSVIIALVAQVSNTFDIDSKKLSKFQDVLNICIGLLSDQPPPKLELGLKITEKKVDKYSSPDIGVYRSVKGTAGIECATLKKTVSIPITLFISATVIGEATGFEFKLTGDLAYDQSKSNPWVASEGSVSGGAGLTLKAGAFSGITTEDHMTGIFAGVQGTSDVSVSGAVYGDGNAIKANASVTINALIGAGTLEVWFDGKVKYDKDIAGREIVPSKTLPTPDAVLLSW